MLEASAGVRVVGFPHAQAHVADGIDDSRLLGARVLVGAIDGVELLVGQLPEGWDEVDPGPPREVDGARYPVGVDPRRRDEAVIFGRAASLVTFLGAMVACFL